MRLKQKKKTVQKTVGESGKKMLEEMFKIKECEFHKFTSKWGI